MLRTLDLFSGVGGITHALRGYATPVMYCEKDPDCHAVIQKLMKQGKLPKAPIHSDITKLTPAGVPGKVDMIVAGFPCFPAGTRVNTDAGYLPIEAVTTERTLLTHTGQYKPINNLQRKLLPAGQPMYALAIRGLRRPIRCTEEHPIYVRRVRTVDGERQLSEPEFVAARDLTEDHWAGMPVDRRFVVPRESRQVVEGNHVWCDIQRVEVETTEKAQWVYNFEVADDNSYCVENVAVHNCIGFSSAGQREGLDQPGSRLFYHVMRLARDLRPPLLFFENVEGILGNSDIRKIVSSIRKLGYALYWVVMTAYHVGAPQKRARWFCLAVRSSLREHEHLRIRSHEPFQRFSWRSEASSRMVPEATPDVRRRVRMLGNSVVPDCVRGAFLSLWTGCSVPLPKLFATTSVLPLTPPKPLGPLGKKRKYACVLGPVWQRIPAPVGMLARPRIGLVLDPRAFTSKKPLSDDATSGLVKKPLRMDLWSTPRAGNGTYAMNYLTNRGCRDLGSQLRFERRTPASLRKGVTNPEFAEWLMGFPRGWTSR